MHEQGTRAAERPAGALEPGAQAPVEALRARAGLLGQIAAELNAEIALDEVLRTTLTRATELLGGDDGALFLLEPDGERLRGAVELTPCGRIGSSLRIEQCANVKQAALSGKPAWVPCGAIPGHPCEWLRATGCHGALLAPLTVKGRCLGILFVSFRSAGHAPSVEDVAFADAIAHQCALAISRAQIYEAERAARARAEAAEEEARRISALQEQLAAIVAHDLRTPLQAITTATTLLLRDGQIGGRQAETLSRVRSSAARMEGIVRDLLDFARARIGGCIPVERRPARIEEICSQAINELQAAYPGRRIDLALSGDGSGEWDPSRLVHVVSNLVGNALKHAPSSAAVEVRASGGDGEVVLEVHNQGPPIPPDVLPVLFEPFRRGVPERRREGSSLGLGLFIVKELVHAHGGTVEARPGERDGVTFTVRLPRRAPRAASPRQLRS